MLFCYLDTEDSKLTRKLCMDVVKFGKNKVFFYHNCVLLYSDKIAAYGTQRLRCLYVVFVCVLFSFWFHWFWYDFQLKDPENRPPKPNLLNRRWEKQVTLSWNVYYELKAFAIVAGLFSTPIKNAMHIFFKFSLVLQQSSSSILFVFHFHWF